MNSKITGFASADKPWLSNYSSIEPVNHERWKGRTVWDVTEEMLEKYSDVPMIEYFGNTISRPMFRQRVIEWAKAFRALGIKEDDIIPVYSPLTPETYMIFFAANLIGAAPYYLKIDLTNSAIETELEDAKIAIVCDAIWDNAKDVFESDNFEKVIIISVADSMKFPAKQILKLKSKFDKTNTVPSGRNVSQKYLTTKDILKLANTFTGEYKAKYKPQRIATVTSSSGTTSHVAKGIMDTNESILAAMACSLESDPGFSKGKRMFTCFPLLASTSLNCEHLLPTFTGWGNVQKVFSDSRFKNIVVLSASDSMMFPLKQISKMKSYFANRRSDAGIPNDAKYIWTNDAIKMAKYYSGEYRIAFESNIIAAITTSSGTTSNNVKGIMDTNEGILSSLGCILHSDSGYGVGKRTLTCFPPTASTSLNCLQLSPTFTGGTIIFDPRADTSIWYGQLMKYKPDVTITTGSVWERFATDILKKEKQGRKHDLSWVDYFIMGGSGTTPRILNRINDILLERGAQREIRVGYGLSEVFGVLSVSVYDGSYQEKNNKKDVISVGIPLNGYTVGIFDESNNELPFGKGLRGELRVKSPSNMEGYYNQPEATSRVLVDGWVRTGDLCEMDELGNIYIYGRTNNAITVEDKKMYLFDIEIDLRRTFNLHDVIVEKRQLADNELSLLVYFVQDSESTISSEELIKQMEEYLALKNIYVNGFKEHMDSLQIDPTTLKPRRRDNDGFIKTIDGEKYDVSFELLEGDVYLEKRVRRG